MFLLKKQDTFQQYLHILLFKNTSIYESIVSVHNCVVIKSNKNFCFCLESEELTIIMLEDIAVCAVTSGIVVIKLNLNVPLPPASSKTKMYSIFTIYKI